MNCRWVASLLCAILLVDLSRAADPKAPPTRKPSQKWALLIGVNDYAYINKLKYCGADMEALRGRLIEAGFPENHVYLLSDNAKDKKYQPYKTNIETQIDLITKLVGKDDVLLLAFAGHGVHLNNIDYVCPVDAKLDESKSTLVSLDSVYERVRKSPAALKIMLVDACRDDPTPGGKRSTSDTAEENRKFAKRLENIPQGIVLLNSCSPGESSMEDPKLAHGVFTYFLLEGLAGKADANSDGVVTLSELAEYVGDQTKNHVASHWAYLQRPYLKGDLSLDAMRFDIGHVRAKTGVNALDSFPPTSIWQNEELTLTILERNGERFRARMVAKSPTINLDRDIRGTVNGGKISWLAKDVTASNGFVGSDNIGIRRGQSIDFTWSDSRGKTGIYTLTLDASYAVQPKSVWVDGTRTLTIIERQGDAFRGRLEEGARIIREMTGTIKDGKLSWLTKDVKPISGGPGGDNTGTLLGQSIDFTWSDPSGASGQFTLQLKRE